MPRRPVNSPYKITTEFGVKDKYSKFGYHTGVDYSVPLNRAVFAPIGGTVTLRDDKNNGKMVIIKAGKEYHRLLHNNAYTVKNGAKVKEGQQVAKAGSTGISTGVHSHWDINTEGIMPTKFSSFIDPDKWLNKPAPKPKPIKKKGTVTVTAKPYLNVRKKPDARSGIARNWSIPLGRLKPGTKVQFVDAVRGQTVAKNNIWLKSVRGNWIWSGGTNYKP